MSYYYVAGLPCSNELYHHGILGQKWGVRRFQNRDGSLTPAGRERYGSGSEDGFGAKAKKMATNAGRAAARTAKAATSYTAKRTKMKHPSLMTDEELRTYTQRLIAEKNYSDLLRYQRQNSGLGKAKAYVGDILKRGGTTLADAGFRRLANRITETEDDRALRKLKAQKAKDELENLQEARGNEEAQKQQREIDRLQREKQLRDLKRQNEDDSDDRAQQREIDRLQREKQLNDLRNNVDSETVDMQRKINQLQQQKQLKDLEKQLDPNRSDGAAEAIADAMRVIGNPNSSMADVKAAGQVLKGYNEARNAVTKLLAKNGQKPMNDVLREEYTSPNVGDYNLTSAVSPNRTFRAASSVANPSSFASPAPAPNPVVPTYEMPSVYTPQTSSPLSTTPDYSNFRMTPVDGSGGGMYDGRLNGYRVSDVGAGGLASTNRYSNYQMPSEEDLIYGNNPRRRSMRG